jgi:hemerythrin-like domain-containing protein
MTHLIESLHVDHHNLGKLLGLLEANLHALQSDDDPDYLLILDIIEYVDSYPDACHHPREDLLFQRAIERDSSVKKEVQPALEQHAQLKRGTRSLLDSLNAVLNDAVLDKRLLIGAIRDYIDYQRAHIVLEESSIYPRIERLLTPEDIHWLDEHNPAMSDPLFGDLVDNRFRQLYKHILEFSSARN